jgi:hypothetical protein
MLSRFRSNTSKSNRLLEKLHTVEHTPYTYPSLDVLIIKPNKDRKEGCKHTWRKQETIQNFGHKIQRHGILEA